MGAVPTPPAQGGRSNFDGRYREITVLPEGNYPFLSVLLGKYPYYARFPLVTPNSGEWSYKTLGI